MPVLGLEKSAWKVAHALQNLLSQASNITFESPRPISIAYLNVLPRLQLRPINPVVFRGSYWFYPWEILSQGGLGA